MKRLTVTTRCDDGGVTEEEFEKISDWTVTTHPAHTRPVLALFRLTYHSKPRVIVAVYGSEGRWVAEDHNQRRTYLDATSILAWREQPAIPAAIQLPLRDPKEP
jgi:hypothetical protein